MTPERRAEFDELVEELKRAAQSEPERAVDKSYTGQIAALRAERDALVPLARLGRHALEACQDGHGMDGGDIQETAVEYSVVAPVPVDPTWFCRVNGVCECDPDGVCYRETAATTAARAVLNRLDREAK